MCLPQDRLSLLRWLETNICVLSAWRAELALDPAALGRAEDIGRSLFALEREAARLRAELGAGPAPDGGRKVH